MMREAIDRGTGEQLITEHLGTIFEGAPSGDDSRTTLETVGVGGHKEERGMHA